MLVCSPSGKRRIGKLTDSFPNYCSQVFRKSNFLKEELKIPRKKSFQKRPVGKMPHFYLTHTKIHRKFLVSLLVFCSPSIRGAVPGFEPGSALKQNNALNQGGGGGV
jgi:hypothetical protein